MSLAGVGLSFWGFGVEVAGLAVSVFTLGFSVIFVGVGVIGLGLGVIGSIFGKSVMLVGLFAGFNITDDLTHSTFGAMGVGVSLNCNKGFENS